MCPGVPAQRHHEIFLNVRSIDNVCSQLRRELIIKELYLLLLLGAPAQLHYETFGRAQNGVGETLGRSALQRVHGFQQPFGSTAW